MNDLSEHDHAPREITRWRGRPFVTGLISFFAVMSLIFAVSIGLTRSWTRGLWPARTGNLGVTADAAWDNRPAQLQTHAATDLRNFRAAEDKILHTVAWTDETHAYATISIGDAMTLLAQPGAMDQLLPAPKPATPIDLQVQKSREAVPSASPTPTP